MNWKAEWIWTGGEISPRNEWWCFRKEFNLPSGRFESFKLSLSADSRYILYVNGSLVGRGPSRSWPIEQSYDVYDIGYLLKQGQKNAIAVLVQHFGVSTFYYVRGRGGLLLQLDGVLADSCETILSTDTSWKLSRYEAQDSTAPRMSCQQAFTEQIDANLLDPEWTKTDYDDNSWQHAITIGPVGTEPWVELKEREIPFLSQDILYPQRIESLKSVKPVDWTASVDIRNHMAPGSEDHANVVQFTGYIAAIIRTYEKMNIHLGFPNACSVFGPCRIDEKWYPRDSFHRVEVGAFLELELDTGDHLFMMDVTGSDHGRGYHMAIRGTGKFDVVSPLSIADGSPFITVGPFDSNMVVDHQDYIPIKTDQEDYKSAADVQSLDELLQGYSKWIRPIANKHVSLCNVFALCTWNKQSTLYPVPYQLQSMVISNNLPAELPLFDGRDTEIIIDFGKEVAGYIEFEVEAAEGTLLDFYAFEYMHHEYIQHTYDLDNTLRYVCRKGRQTYQSCVYRGFRYLMVTVRNAKAPVKMYQVKMTQSTYPVAEIGKFQCSDAMLNKIWEISQYTTKLCMEDTFVDCPAYEQVFWVGDSRNESLINYYTYGAHDIVKRCLRLVPPSDCHTPLYTDHLPSGWSSVIPDWTFFWVIACSDYYQRTGDLAFLHEITPKAAYTLDHYLLKIDDRGLLSLNGWNLLDWAPMDQPNSGVVTHQNMFLVKALATVSEMYDIIGNSEKAQYYIQRAQTLKDAVNRYLWTDEKNAYRDCIHADGRLSDIFSMQTQVVAYLCDIAEGERKEFLENYLEGAPEGFVKIGSPFMSFFYYEALTKSGKYELMVKDILANYGDMVEHGATTCWEVYANSFSNILTRSHCHAWSAAPAYFLGAYILGVHGTTPGWSTVKVAPNPCGLSWASGAVPLPENGRIDVDWKIGQDQKLKIRVAAPKEIQVDIEVPKGYVGEVELAQF